MRIAPTLLRVILALSLILNGSGLAAAHPGDAARDAAAVVSAFVDGAAVDEPPCHEMPERGNAGHDSHASTAEGDLAKAGQNDHHADPDCCDMGTCDNACPQPLSAALTAAALVGLHARPGAHPQAMPTTRAGPRLPHPIRPPIA